MALVATVGASDANSYLTVADATQLLSIRFGIESWTNATESDKGKALQLATLQIDQCQFQGVKLAFTQALQFPRDQQDQAFDQIPPEVQQACAVQALAILKNPDRNGLTERQAMRSEGVKEFSIGNFSERFQSWGSPSARHLCPEAARFLQGWVSRGGHVLGPGDRDNTYTLGSNWPWR